MGEFVVFVSACDFSGDMHGGVLLQEIKKKIPDVRFYGVGGSNMVSAGMEQLIDPTTKSTIGYIEVIKNLNLIKKVYNMIYKEWDKRKPDMMLWLDAGGFNLPLAKEAKKRNIPVVCMFSPSAWAYGQDRAVKVADRVKHLLAVLPFEADFYRKFGTKVTYVGHPLIDRVKNETPPEEYRKSLGLKPNQKLVVLMPGSRRQEIKNLLSPMLEAACQLNKELDIKWTLAVAKSIDFDYLKSLIDKYSIKVELVTENIYNLLAAADGAIIKSGTSTLEAAILNTPMVVIYKMSPLSFMIYRIKQSSEHKRKGTLISLPNLILDKEITPEFLQKTVTVNNITNQMRLILSEDTYNKKIRNDLSKVKELISPPGVMERAAGIISDVLLKKDE